MNYRNAELLENGWIDCEIEHPVHGWIPFTCNPEDSGAAIDTAELHAKMVVDPNTQPYVPPTAEEMRMEKVVEVRTYRNHILATQVDPLVTNPLRWSDLTESEKIEVAEYRTALLDITEQVGFPDEIVWPVAPPTVSV